MVTSAVRNNVEFFDELMNFSRFGALAQFFVIDALDKHSKRVSSVDPKTLEPSSVLNVDAWCAVATEIARKISDRKEITNVDLVTDILEFSKYGGLSHAFVVEAVTKHAVLLATAPIEAFPTDGPIHPPAWRGVAREIAAKIDEHFGWANSRVSPLVDQATGESNRYSYMTVLKSAAGWYIGTTVDTEYGPAPGTRDSLEYWPTSADAEAAFRDFAYTQRRHP